MYPQLGVKFEILVTKGSPSSTLAVRQMGCLLNENPRTIMNEAYSCIFDNLGDLGWFVKTNLKMFGV